MGCKAGAAGLKWVCAYMIYAAYTRKEETHTTFDRVRAKATSPHATGATLLLG